MIKGGTPHTQEEVLDIMSTAPKDWLTYVRWRNTPDMSQVLMLIRLWDHELLALWEQSHGEGRRLTHTRAHAASTVQKPKLALTVGAGEPNERSHYSAKDIARDDEAGTEGKE